MSSGTVEKKSETRRPNGDQAASDDGWILCTYCWERLPAEHFRYRVKAKGLRHVQCRLCNNKEQRALNARHRAKRIGEFAQSVNKNRHDHRRLEAAYIEITRVFGGIQQFNGYWKEAIDSATAAGKHHLVARHFLAIANIGIAADQASIEQPSMEMLSDEELERKLEESLKVTIAQNPALAVRAALQLGWEVIPPGTEVDVEATDSLAPAMADLDEI